MPPRRPDKFDVVVVGDLFEDWLAALHPDSDIWEHVPNVRSVTIRGDAWRGDDIDPATRLVLPLLEWNIRACPAGWGLVPGREPFEILADKAAFDRYMVGQHLERYTPATVHSAESVRFPAVVKRTDLYAGYGIRLVHDADELAATLAEDTWAGRPFVIQEYIEGGTEYVFHAVVANGLFRWTSMVEVVIPAEAPIRHPNSGETLRLVEPPASEIFACQRIIAPLGFSGPVNFNFRRRPGGDLALFEINPRFGGSIFRALSRQRLPQMLSAIVANAQWYEPPA